MRNFALLNLFVITLGTACDPVYYNLQGSGGNTVTMESRTTLFDEKEMVCTVQGNGMDCKDFKPAYSQK